MATGVVSQDHGLVSYNYFSDMFLDSQLLVGYALLSELTILLNCT